MIMKQPELFLAFQFWLDEYGEKFYIFFTI
jgi:hypothetical protein